MRRKPYLARIVEDATAKRRQSILAPPRLLFRPGSTQFDVGMDAEPGSTRGRSTAARDSAVRGTESGGDERGIRSPGWATQRAEWLDSLERPAQMTRPRQSGQRAGSQVDGSGATGSQAAGSEASDSQIAGSRLAGGNPQVWTRSNMTARTGDAALKSAEAIAALRERAQLQDDTPAERRDSPAKASSQPSTQHGVSDTAKLAGSPSQHHDLKPTAAASVQVRSRKGDRGEGDSDELARDEVARGNWHQVTSERAPSHRASPKAEVTPRLDLNPREPRRDTPARKDEAGGRVRIGTLELRILPPPNTPREVMATPSPARRVAAAPQPAGPLARGFGVFGLPQS
jgi:hypothetical protein